MKYTLAVLLVAALFLGACTANDENLAGDARFDREEKVKPTQGNDQPGSDLYEFEDYDQYEFLVSVTNAETGATKEFSVRNTSEGLSGQLVHEGQSFDVKYVRENVLSLDIDNDGSYETVAFLGNTFEVPSYR